MKPRDVPVYLENRLSESVSGIETYLESRDDEALHRFRIAIKKFNSLYRFYPASSWSDSLHKNAERLQKLFSLTGPIRDILVQNKLLGEKYIQLLDVPERREKMILLHNKINKYFRKHEDSFRKRASIFKGQSVRHMNKFSREKLLEILDKALSELMTGDNQFWHKARKRIKKILYLYPMVYGRDKEKYMAIKKIVHILDQIQDAIGKWHDWEVLLKEFHNLNIDKENKSILRKLALRKSAKLRKRISYLSENLLLQSPDIIRALQN